MSKRDDVSSTYDYLRRSRPILIEKHDVAAKLFRRPDSEEPAFSFSLKGEHRLDLYKIFTCVTLFLLWLFSMKVYFGAKRAKRRWMKEKKKAAKRAGK